MMKLKIKWTVMVILACTMLANHLKSQTKDVGFDNNGNFYHMGLTGANLSGTLIGETDVYLVKLKLDISFLNH